MYESNGGCGSSATTDSTTGTTIYKYGYYTVHNAMYSPSPWTSNTGGTLGGGSKTVSIGGTTTSGPAQAPRPTSSTPATGPNPTR